MQVVQPTVWITKPVSYACYLILDEYKRDAKDLTADFEETEMNFIEKLKLIVMKSNSKLHSENASKVIEHRFLCTTPRFILYLEMYRIYSQ